MTRYQRLFTAIVLAQLMGSPAGAQTRFPPDALVNAANQQNALAVLGAAQAENSGYLLLDSPDIAAQGTIKVIGKSLLPGTSQLILLRATRFAGRATAERPFVAASQAAPGKPAVISTAIDADSTLNLTLLAQARGKWYFVSREVKIGR